MTPADTIALLGIALPLIAKVSVDFAAYLATRKHAALANIIGMAGRQAASAARTLANLPAGTDVRETEQALIANARATIIAEMSGNVKITKGNEEQVATIVQGELDKLVVAPVAVLPAPQVVPTTTGTPSP